MKLFFLLFTVFAFNAHAQGNTSSNSCKSKVAAEGCISVKGAFGAYSGAPLFRISIKNPFRKLGVYDAAAANNENPALPKELNDLIIKNNLPKTGKYICGQFELCPLEKMKKGNMQKVCMTRAENLSLALDPRTCL